MRRSGWDSRKAESLIHRCRDSSTVLAREAVSAIIAGLEQLGHRVVGAGLLSGSGRALPELAATLQSHALITRRKESSSGTC